jgi:hypothetical protein
MERGVFFDVLRHTSVLGPKLSVAEVTGTEAILDALAGFPRSWVAYALATAWHETAFTMQPVREGLSKSDAWRRTKLSRYYPYYGRGYVQLTWRENYARADAELGLNGALLADLDLALRPDIAAAILRRGMEEGWFAGDAHGRHTLTRHLPRDRSADDHAFRSARRIINGTDRAAVIAGHAATFQRALHKAGM